MTEGKPGGILWRFSLPMLLSVAFQQMYNIADSVIAGQFVSEEALAAIGASYPVTMIFMAVGIGSNIGCSVVISQLFGAKQYKEMKTAVFTSIFSILCLSVIFTVFGTVFCGKLITMLKTPENIFPDASLYLGVYILGLVFLFLYNICTGIFTALGDSNTPLIFLIASSVGNIILDLVFVICFRMGVAGVAWATFLAQGVASLLALLFLLKRIRLIETEGKIRMFSASMLGRISKIAVPSILQQSFVSVGNLFIQWLINGYGSAVIAGYSAAVRLNTFAITSFSALSNGVSSFTAQNIGAQKPERVRQGLRAGLVMGVCVAVPFFIAFFVFSRHMVYLFMSTPSEQAVAVGMTFLRIVSPFYIVILVKLIMDSVLRGAGATVYFTITTFADLVLRTVLAFVFAWYFGETGIWASWPVGWSAASVLSVIFYLKGNWQKGIARPETN